MRLAMALVLVLGACKGDPVKCDQGCRNFATLQFWKEADAEIAKAPADQRDAMRKAKLGELAKVFDRGLDMCVSQCVSVNNDETAECMIAAKTAEQVADCAK